MTGRDFYYGCGASAIEQKYRSAVTHKECFSGKKKNAFRMCKRRINALREIKGVKLKAPLPCVSSFLFFFFFARVHTHYMALLKSA